MLNQNNDLKKFLFANLNFIQKGICVQTEEKQLVKRCSSQLPLKQQVLLNQRCTAHLQKATDYHQEPHLFINNREGHLRYFTVRITSLILTLFLNLWGKLCCTWTILFQHNQSVKIQRPFWKWPSALAKWCQQLIISTTVWILVWKMILVGKIAWYY